MNIRFAFALVLVAGTVAAYADSPVLVLDEVVVTAERIAHPIRDIAASVSLVTAEEINRANASTATDVLSGLPGGDAVFRFTVRIQGDVDGNGGVDVVDLLALLAAWGPCPPPGDCPADFDGDGTVDVSDLLTMLGHWG